MLFPDRDEILTEFGANLGSALPPSSPGPARRALHPSQSAQLREVSSAWTQPEQPASRGGLAGPGIHAAGAPRMPRVSQPLRVEPPAEYNAPRRLPPGQSGGRRPGAPRPKADQLKDYAVRPPWPQEPPLARTCQRARGCARKCGAPHALPHHDARSP